LIRIAFTKFDLSDAIVFITDRVAHVAVLKKGRDKFIMPMLGSLPKYKAERNKLMQEAGYVLELVYGANEVNPNA